MAVNRRRCEAPPERVFDALADPRLYAYFVVGTRTVRWFDPRWPDPGSAFHYSLGFGVTVLSDATMVVEAEPPTRLVLRLRMRRFGDIRTVFRLTPEGAGTLVEVEEFPLDGPIAAEAVSQLVDGVVWLRNMEVLRRLCSLVEGREEQRRRAEELEARRQT